MFRTGIRYAAVFPEPVIESVQAIRCSLSLLLTSLRDGDHIVSKTDCRNAVALDWSRCVVTGQLDIPEHHRVETGGLEVLDWVDPRNTFLVQFDVCDPGAKV